MAKFFSNDSTTEAKSRKWAQYNDFSSEIDHLVAQWKDKSTKKPKNAQSTVKTAKNPCGEVVLDSFSYLRASGEPMKAPDSTPNPNEAFRRLKYGKTSVTEFLRLAKETGDKL